MRSYDGVTLSFLKTAELTVRASYSYEPGMRRENLKPQVSLRRCRLQIRKGYSVYVEGVEALLITCWMLISLLVFR